MEMRHLESFKVLTEELHFGRAARRLFISQPPLSRRIRDLEAELGVPLFVRDNRNVRPTAFGEYFQAEVGRLFERLEEVKNHLHLMKEGVSGEVRIGYVGAVMHSVLPGLLLELRRSFPDIHAVLSELTNEGQIAGLRAGAIDLGFIRTPVSAPDLAVRPVFSEAFSLIVPGSHPLARSRSAPLARLAGEPFIGFARDCAPAMVDAIIRLCGRAGFSPRIVHVTSQINSIVRLVESGLGWSIVPSSVKNAYRLNVRFYDLDRFPERAELSVAHNPLRLTPVAAKVLTAVDQMSRAGLKGRRSPLAHP